MKKYIAILLIVTLLLLSGCAPASGESAVPEQTSAPPEEAKPQMRLVSVTIEGIMGDINSSTTQEFHYDEQGFLKEMVSYSGNTKITETYMDGVLSTRVSSTYAPVEQEG